MSQTLNEVVVRGATVIVDQDKAADLRIVLTPQSDVVYVGVLGLGQSSKRLHFVLQDGARLRCTTVCCGAASDRIAADYIIEHVGRGSTAFTLVKGVFSDTARAEIFGLIKIPSSGQQTESFLEQRALLLSDTAYANLQPKLQIEANDLKASHAATVGQLDANQLFYCQSRGLPRATAARLIVRAFLAEALAAVAQPELRGELQQALDRKMALA